MIIRALTLAAAAALAVILGTSAASASSEVNVHVVNAASSKCLFGEVNGFATVRLCNTLPGENWTFVSVQQGDGPQIGTLQLDGTNLALAFSSDGTAVLATQGQIFSYNGQFFHTPKGALSVINGALVLGHPSTVAAQQWAFQAS